LSSEKKERHNQGYRGKILKLLSEKRVSIGDHINVRTKDDEFTGILIPRYESTDENYLVIKLKSGYNIGIELHKIQDILKVIQRPIQTELVIPTTKTVSREYDDILQPTTKNEDKYLDKELLPKVALISTGGTIASKIDYRTGGVHAALSAGELYASVPELAKYTSIDPDVLLNEYSENLNPDHWTLIANRVAEKVKSGNYRGIIVSHGTDTLHYTAAALSFALQNLPIPVILVGAQRSSDRPSSDASMNLIGAAIFAIKSEFSGVFVTMHANYSDDIIACHIGTRVRKNHTSRRDAFKSIDVKPIAIIKGDTLEMQMQQSHINLQKRNNNCSNSFIVKPSFDRKVILLKYYPGFDPELIDHAIISGYKAIIIEGTGLGHISRECFSKIQQATESNKLVFMTSQCIWGRIGMTVYNTGRDLLNIGVIPLSNMITETAIVKAMWALANSKDTKSAMKIMQENIANETSTVISI
jgi:glutamyl-tRNA(Gln) amidotransferase subunit D